MDCSNLCNVNIPIVSLENATRNDMNGGEINLNIQLFILKICLIYQYTQNLDCILVNTYDILVNIFVLTTKMQLIFYFDMHNVC